MTRVRANMMCRCSPLSFKDYMFFHHHVFQCKFSNQPGGCKRQDCRYFHPDRSAQPDQSSTRSHHDRFQRSRSRCSKEDERVSPGRRTGAGAKRGFGISSADTQNVGNNASRLFSLFKQISFMLILNHCIVSVSRICPNEEDTPAMKTRAPNAQPWRRN